MIKTIKMDGRDVSFNASLSWAFVYKDQFSSDPLKVVMPALISIYDGSDDGKVEFNAKTLERASEHIDLVSFLQILWSLAKNADRDIPEPEEWYGQFDTFPMDDVLKEIAPMLAKSCISLKNFQALTSAGHKKAAKKPTSKASLQAV